jgi:uncharacterized iron-regulated protein
VKSLAAFILLLSLLLPGAGSADAHTLRVADGSYVSLPELVADLLGVRLVFMGEIHDNAAHHRAQLQVIRALREAGAKVAVGLEMFRRDSQGALDLWVAGRMSEESFLKVYHQNWSMWPQYREIFHYARQAGIPLVSLNLPREITQQVARSGFASLSPQQLGELPGVRCDVDARYQEFIRRALGGHGHNGNSFLHFCEAQLLWDTVMAQALLDYLARNPEAVVVVLAGNGHAWKFGIPEQIRRRGDVPLRVLLPELRGRIEAGNVTANEADYLLLGLDQGPLH